MVNSDSFIHTHMHSEHSLLDGMSRPSEIAKIVSENGQLGSVLTDHGTMSGTLKFQNACDKNGIKAIHGCEFYYVPQIATDSEDKTLERFHLIVLAKNQQGLNKLFKLQQKSWERPNFYMKPRIDFDDINYLAGDVVVLSGCMASVLCRTLEENESGEEIVSSFKRVFNNDYYIELQPWNSDDLNDSLSSLATAFDIRTVATIDCHYMTQREAGLEEVLLMSAQMDGIGAAGKRFAKEQAQQIWQKKTDLTDKINQMYPDRKLRFDKISPYVMSTQQVCEAFPGHDESIENTMEIYDKCNAKIEKNRSLLPVYWKKGSDEYLKEIAMLFMEEKKLTSDEYIARLNEELGTISQLGFSDYFLIVWDILNWADQHGIRRGPGRGSVGGSLLAYALGITKIDPLEYDLLFSRFLDLERKDYPDIDMDFEDRRREEVKQYAYDKWGYDNVASISTYGEFGAKSSIKKIASVFQIDYQDMNKLTPMFDSLDELKNLDKGVEFDRKYPDIIPIVERVEGRIKEAGAHAAGVVISSIPLWMVCPLETRGIKGEENRLKVTAYTMNEIQELGLIKFDFLGLKNLAVIEDCINKIKEIHGVDVEETSFTFDDQEVIDRFNYDSMLGIFQAEGAGYKNLIAKMGISSFDDLVASNALVRPGAMNTQGAQYIGCKKGERKVKYVHEILEPILKDTFGTFVFQEQLMFAVHILAGFTMVQANSMRKIIGKKLDAKEFLPYKDKFIEGCQKYITKSDAENLWSDFERTNAYMFPKAHAVGYSMLSYQGMWLKHYYAKEFMWALLANESEKEDISAYLMESSRLGLNIKGPDVNISGRDFTLEEDGIRFGLSNVSGCGPTAIDDIINKRPFASFEEFDAKRKKAAVRANVLLNLEKVGAFESLGHAPYDAKKYYLEILSCSMYAETDTRYQNIITPCAEVENGSGIRIIRGIVKDTKRKPNYFRVAFEDSSGSFAAFADQQAEIKSKEYLFGIIADKTLCAFEHVNNEEPSEMQKFLDIYSEKKNEFDDYSEYGCGKIQDGSKSVCMVIGNRWFKTKSGQIMSNVWLFDPCDFEFKKLTVFSGQYMKHMSLLKPFQWIVAKVGSSKGLILEDAISLDTFKEMKGI